MPDSIVSDPIIARLSVQHSANLDAMLTGNETQEEVDALNVKRGYFLKYSKYYKREQVKDANRMFDEDYGQQSTVDDNSISFFNCGETASFEGSDTGGHSSAPTVKSEEKDYSFLNDFKLNEISLPDSPLDIRKPTKSAIHGLSNEPAFGDSPGPLRPRNKTLNSLQQPRRMRRVSFSDELLTQSPGAASTGSNTELIDPATLGLRSPSGKPDSPTASDYRNSPNLAVVRDATVTKNNAALRSCVKQPTELFSFYNLDRTETTKTCQSSASNASTGKRDSVLKNSETSLKTNSQELKFASQASVASKEAQHNTVVEYAPAGGSYSKSMSDVTEEKRHSEMSTSSSSKGSGIVKKISNIL